MCCLALQRSLSALFNGSLARDGWSVCRELGIAYLLQLHDFRGSRTVRDSSGTNLSFVNVDVQRRGQFVPFCIHGRGQFDIFDGNDARSSDPDNPGFHDVVSMHDQKISILRISRWQWHRQSRQHRHFGIPHWTRRCTIRHMEQSFHMGRSLGFCCTQSSEISSAWKYESFHVHRETEIDRSD